MSNSGRVSINAGSGRVDERGRSGEIPTSGRARSGVIPRGTAAGAVVRRDGRRRAAMLVLAIAIGSFGGWAVWANSAGGDGEASIAGLPRSYRMACRTCDSRFEMSPVTYRQALHERTDRSVNRIACPKCGATDAAYRVDSGMNGLGELGPDGDPLRARLRSIPGAESLEAGASGSR